MRRHKLGSTSPPSNFSFGSNTHASSRCSRQVDRTAVLLFDKLLDFKCAVRTHDSILPAELARYNPQLVPESHASHNLRQGWPSFSVGRSGRPLWK
jgi:hypothetical protein